MFNFVVIYCLRVGRVIFIGGFFFFKGEGKGGIGEVLCEGVLEGERGWFLNVKWVNKKEKKKWWKGSFLFFNFKNKYYEILFC